MLEPGKILQERYRIERHVGQGGMGSVYLATDQRFHSTVAIKEALIGDEKYRKAFEREARLLNSLKNPALPKVSDHFVEDNGQYIVMEYIGGDDLFEMMRKSGRPFPVADVMDWAAQLLDALSYLHKQGIIHRDIKPQNLKLTPQNQIILLDFGLAKGNPTDANYQTAAQSIFGYSRNYASLEQIQGTGTDPRSDVYSLAATLYHLMTGRVPADALTRVMMVVNENSDPLEPPGLFNSDITQEVSDALGKCLALKASSRPDNADQMRAILHAGESTPFEKAGAGAGIDPGLEFLTQNTQIIEDRGIAGETKPTDHKTEVMAPNQTNLKTTFAGNETVSASSPETIRKPMLGGNLGRVIAAVLFLVIGSIAATVFVSSISDDRKSPAPVKSNSNESFELKGTVTNTSVVNSMQIGNTNSSEANTTSTENTPVNQTISPTDGPVQKSADTIPSKPKPKAAQIRKDGVTITDGRVTTGGVTVNERGVVVRITPVPRTPPPDGLPMTREQYDKLSPREKRRVRAIVEEQQRRNKNQVPPPPPPPTPTPKPKQR